MSNETLDSEIAALGSGIETGTAEEQKAFYARFKDDTDYRFRQLAFFAYNCWQAQQHRLAGCIGEALAFEERAEFHYKNLPKFARW